MYAGSHQQKIGLPFNSKKHHQWAYDSEITFVSSLGYTYRDISRVLGINTFVSYSL